MTIVLRRMTADDWATWRPVRLAALADAPHRAELISMWVDPGGRRRGVARLLIDAVAAWAAGYGAHELVLSVMPDDRDAREADAHTGFSAADEAGDLLPDGRRELVMRRDLEERP